MSLLRRIGGWLDDRLGLSSTLLPIAQHPVPPTDWGYVLGSAALTVFIVQVVTGVALAFSYVPSPDHAYDSINFITHQEDLGNIVRGIHYWGASAMVVLVLAHMAQVFLIGAYKYPREVNWLTGSLLLLMTFGMGFTGQLLRWDQDAYWAVVVGAAQAGRAPIIGTWLTEILIAGQTVGGATLERFYATHVFLIPAVIFGLIGVHLYLVIRHGISEPPGETDVVHPSTYRQRYEELVHKVGVPFWPDAAWKDVVFALAVGVVVLGLAIVLGPPVLGKPPDPTIIQANPRPEWYFIWYFALLALIPSGIEDWFIIGFPLLLGLLFLTLPFIAPSGERSPKRRPWAIAIIAFSTVAVGTLVREGYVAPWSPNFDPGNLPVVATASLTGDAPHGAVVFQEKGCINCHTIDGVGGGRGPNLSDVGDRLGPDELTSRILNGGTNMPAYGTNLQPEDLTALVDFLQTQKNRSQGP